MQGIVVPIAQGHGELIRYLEAQRARLSEANVVRLRGPAAADEAGLTCNEGEVRLVADALLFRESAAEPALLRRRTERHC